VIAKEHCTFKIGQKTNSTYLELHFYTRKYDTLKVLFRTCPVGLFCVAAARCR